MGTALEPLKLECHVSIDPRIEAKPPIVEAINAINEYFRLKYPATQDRLNVEWESPENSNQLRLKLTGWRKLDPTGRVAVERTIPIEDMTNPLLRDLWGIHAWGDLLDAEGVRGSERLKMILAQPDEVLQNGD